jgi:PAS domain S-box-containing protein
MVWYKNRTTVRYATAGFLVGFVFPFFGFLLEFSIRHLPYTIESFLSVQQTQPLIWIIELAPLVLGFMAGMAGQKYSFVAIISQAKREWETTFDAFSDPIFITNKEGSIVRCNHAVLDRLNSTYKKVLRRQLTDILSEGQKKNNGESNYSGSEIPWFGRVYDMAIYPISAEGMPENIICILHDITERKQAEAEVEQSEILFRALFDRSPDAVVLIDPHALNVSWPIIDCNIAACLMNGYSREELIGHSIDILNVTSGTQAERTAYLAQLREAGNFKIETQHRHKNGFVFSVDVSTSIITLRERELIIGIDRDISERKRAEEALRENQSLYHSLVEVSPLSICRKDLAGRFTFANRRFLELSHITLTDLVGKTDFDLHSPELAEKYRYDDQAVMNSGEVKELIEERAVMDGEFTIVQSIKTPIYDGTGKINGIQISFWDITDRKRAEVALSESESRFRSLFDDSPISLWDEDFSAVKQRLEDLRADGVGDFNTYFEQHPEVVAQCAALVKVMDVNTATINLYGAASKKDIVTNLANIFLEDGNESFKNELVLIASGVTHFEMETVNRTLDGRLLTVNLNWAVIPGHEGDLSKTIVSIIDITERRRVELETLKQKQYFESLVNNSPVAIVVMDNDEKIASINPAFEKLYGYTSKEVIGVVLDTLITTQETRGEAARYSQEIMEGAIHGIVRRRRKDGTLVDVELSGVPIIVAGEKLGGLALYHDITELVQSRREAEEANRAKSEFLANMSHEIRTPMNGVIGMLELALDTKLTSEQTDYLQTSLHSAEALLTLLNDILDFSKIEAGRLELEAINFSLRNAVEDVAYTLARRAQEKGLEMACLVDPDLASSLRGDPGRLRQILVNLVGNAIKFTHQGEIVIRAEPREETDRYVTVHFSVQDTGIGIPYERQAAVFERFTQADGTTTRTYGGTGLGLTISKQLVEAMGGTIGLESKPGIGTTFWFDLEFEKLLPEKRGVTGPLTSFGPVNLTHARILIVDDNQTNRMVLIKNVEALGSRVDAVSSGAKGIESLRNAHRAGDPYHVVLLDMQMPGMDGEQTARAIKSDPSIKDVKILILTSMGQRGDASRLEALGCSGYLLKPVKQQMLFDAVLAVLGRSEDESASLITRHILSEKRTIGIRLLLAEDNPVNQKLAVILLQKAGYLVDAVETGAQALEKIQTHPYSAVLMDVQMPEMDGFEATRLIRAWETQNGQHIPIIAMTAHAMAGDRERCIESGMDDYVAKPLEPRVLFNAIDRWIQIADYKKELNQQTPQDSPADDPINFSADLGRNWLGDDTPSAPSTPPKPDPAPQAVSPADELPADLEAALFRFSGDRAFMKEMCQEFKAHLPARIEEFNSALHNGDIKTIGRLAHNLKGVCLNFNAQPLADIAEKLEICGRQENLTDAPALIQKVEKEITRLQEYLSQQLS